MTIEKIGLPLDREELDKLNRNLENLNKLDYKIMQDFLRGDPSQLTPQINGLMRSSDLDMRLLNDFGTNFVADVNGVIYKAQVYAGSSGELGFGLAEQATNDVASSELYFKVVEVKSGWNEITLNFPVQQGKQYTLFKRIVGENILTNSQLISGWNTYPFISNGLTMEAGKYLNQTGTYRNYTPFYEIQLITSLAQIYKIANDSVIPPQQFYVGDNPPVDAQFWFKPVGGN